MNEVPNKSQRAHLSRRAATVFVVWSGVASVVETLTPCAFALTQAGEKASAGTFTFEERVASQYVIEEVYWRHRIWPKDNTGPKPSLDVLVSQREIEKKIEIIFANHSWWQMNEDRQSPRANFKLRWSEWLLTRETLICCTSFLKGSEIIHSLSPSAWSDPFWQNDSLGRRAFAQMVGTARRAVRCLGSTKRRARRSRPAKPPTSYDSHCSVDWQRNDYMGRGKPQRWPKYRRQI